MQSPELLSNQENNSVNPDFQKMTADGFEVAKKLVSIQQNEIDRLTKEREYISTIPKPNLTDANRTDLLKIGDQMNKAYQLLDENFDNYASLMGYNPENATEDPTFILAVATGARSELKAGNDKYLADKNIDILDVNSITPEGKSEAEDPFMRLGANYVATGEKVPYVKIATHSDEEYFKAAYPKQSTKFIEAQPDLIKTDKKFDVIRAKDLFGEKTRTLSETRKTTKEEIESKILLDLVSKLESGGEIIIDNAAYIKPNVSNELTKQGLNVLEFKYRDHYYLIARKPVRPTAIGKEELAEAA